MNQKAIYDRARYLRKKAERILNSKPDPIYSIPKIERAYIAGLIDGEGSIHITRKAKNGTFYAFVTVRMSDYGVIKWLADKFENKVVDNNYPKQGSFNTKPKTIYGITLQGRRAALLCEILLPYLKVKVKQAKLLLEYPCDARMAWRKKIDGSPINEVRKILKEKMTELNGYYYKKHHPGL
jgi:hypothetical protein